MKYDRTYASEPSPAQKHILLDMIQNVYIAKRKFRVKAWREPHKQCGVWGWVPMSQVGKTVIVRKKQKRNKKETKKPFPTEATGKTATPESMMPLLQSELPEMFEKLGKVWVMEAPNEYALRTA